MVMTATQTGEHTRAPVLFYSAEHKLFALTGQPNAQSTRRAYVTLLPEHSLPEANRATMHRKALPYSAQSARISLIANPMSKTLEAHDHVTLTVSSIEARLLEPSVALTVMASKGADADRAAYNQQLRIAEVQRKSFAPSL